MSNEMKRLLLSAITLDPLATLGDVADLVDAASDAKLCLLCRAATPGEPAPYRHTGRDSGGRRVTRTIPALSYSCQLRKRLAEELAELELDGAVWAADVLVKARQLERNHVA